METMPHKSKTDPFQTSNLWSLLDQVLRNREAFFIDIFEGQNTVKKLGKLLFAITVLCAFYGVIMGAMGLGNDWQKGLCQILSTAIKVPALFLLSLAVCYPVLYFVIVLMGGKLRFDQVLCLILLSLTLTSVLLASCAPIILFFMVTGSSYEFIKLLHVLIFAFSGTWGMVALFHGLTEACEKSNLYPKKAIRILQVWALVFGFVASQMTWSLRPFIGSPEKEFEIFRKDQGSNLYIATAMSIKNLLLESDLD